MPVLLRFGLVDGGDRAKGMALHPLPSPDRHGIDRLPDRAMTSPETLLDLAHL